MTKLVFLESNEPDQRKLRKHFSIDLTTETGIRRTMEMWRGMLARTCFTKTSLPTKDRVFARHLASLLLKAAIRASKWYFCMHPNSNGASRYLLRSVEDLKLKVAL